MNREDILRQMDNAFREDRARFFNVADTLHLQPKYAQYLEELESLKQTWRDIPQQDGYPNFTHPIEMPSWFPRVPFASAWQKDVFIEQKLNENNQFFEVR